ncbi:MAG: hypothetical protein A3F72_07280 [Bacteroidetes bacterium RIFCSPLOWO2_12_FULL_35_15]|nr:MAG: hypothetical protein A3F72_07280 [Bacteroidetes bacterium RIFCSPLOWO2_12_FULL_35_15]
MIYYSFLLVFTLLIIFLTYKIWIKTKEPAFVLGIALLYYWTFLGSWFIVIDGLNDQIGKEWGLHYYHFFKRLFQVVLDNNFILSIVYYGIFIVVIQVCVLYFTKRSDNKEINKITPVFINDTILIIGCIAGVIISCGMVWKEILTAAKFEESIYVVTRHQPGHFFTLHQLINFCIVIALYIGLISFISGKDGKYINSEKSKRNLFLYIFCVFFVEGYLLLLGNKREIFFAGIFGALFYYSNVAGKVKWRSILILVFIVFTPMLFNDGLRAYSPVWLCNYFDTSGLELHLDMDIQYTEFSVKNSALAFLFSNEMFCANFSMYGALSHHIPFTYGSSIYSFVYSLVPRILLPNRPETIYEYYVKYVNAAPGQGYTIHHATGWFLNFGLAGIIAGASLLGYLWAWFYNKKNTLFKVKNKFMKLFFIIGLSAFTAQIPSIVRSGPEAYKALIFEALIIPTLIIFVSTLFIKNKKVE